VASKTNELITVPSASDMTIQTLRMHIMARHSDMRGFQGRKEHDIMHLIEKDAGTETHHHLPAGEQTIG